MAKPLPPIVHGPVTTLSPSVRVSGALAGADVVVLEDGTPIGNATAAANGDLVVGLASKPTIGRNISAVQKNADGSSDASPFPVVVGEVPNPLPTPQVASTLHTCVTDVWANALVPGATVHVEIGGQPFAATLASEPGQWLGIDSSKPVPAGAQLAIWQEFTPAGGPVVKSATATSLPIPAYPVGNHGILPPPKLRLPLRSCDTSRIFDAVAGGAVTVLDNEGVVQEWPNPADSYLGVGGAPLRKGKLVARQFMRRCGFEGEKAEYSVDPPAPPGAPGITAHICPDSRRLHVTGLTGGSVLHLRRRVEHAGGSTSFTDYMDMGVGSTEQDLDLPASFALEDPTGAVKVELWQECCGVLGPALVEPVIAMPAAHAPATLVSPIYDCARGLRIRGASPGALLQAFDASSGKPISAVVAAPVPDFVLFTWFPLPAGMKVVVRQTGCNAGGDSAIVVVAPLPSPLPLPVLKKPMRPGATSVLLAKLVPGATVVLLVNNVARTPGTLVWDDVAPVSVPGAALAEGQQVLAVQLLCASSSQREGHGDTVTRGRLKLSVVPASVTIGTTVNVTVTAVDADTGDPVQAKVLLNGKQVALTGQPFAFAPKAGDPTPAGIVSEPVGYVDQSFTITLVAPPPPSWDITLQASPKRSFFYALPIDISAAHFTVVADWDSTIKRSVTATPTTNSPVIAGKVSLPAPTGAVNTVTVNVTVDWSNPAGMIDQYNYATATSTQSSALACKIAHNASAHTASWLATVQYVQNPSTGQGYFTLALTLAGIVP